MSIKHHIIPKQLKSVLLESYISGIHDSLNHYFIDLLIISFFHLGLNTEQL